VPARFVDAPLLALQGLNNLVAFCDEADLIPRLIDIAWQCTPM
jgi:hypothetical protein